MAKFFVAGEPQDSESKQTTEVRNPATGEVVDTVPKGSVNDIRRAIDAAAGALKKWSQMAPSKRGAILLAAGRLILEQEKELATLLTKEQGKPMRESILEMRRFVHTLDHYGGMAKSLRTAAVVLDNGRHGLVLRKPIGVCGAIVPWNFPVSLMGNKLGPALLAGNTVVVKPAGTTPLTDIRCVELIDKAIQAGGGPKGVINVVTGPGSVVGEELLVNPTVRKIGFTGATDTGRRVMQSAAKDFKHVTLELGGSDPMIVCEDADLDRAVSAASVGRFFNCGQACLAVKRLYLVDKIADLFTEKLVEKAKKLRIGNGLNRDTIMGSLPPNSKVTCLKSFAADCITRLPVSVAPVKPILRTVGLTSSSSPTTLPGPVTTLMTPLGPPPAWIALSISSTQRISVSGVVPAGLTTTVLPAKRAGPSLLPISETGKFHGTIAPQTPIGLRRTKPWRPLSSTTAAVRRLLAMPP